MAAFHSVAVKGSTGREVGTCSDNRLRPPFGLCADSDESSEAILLCWSLMDAATETEGMLFWWARTKLSRFLVPVGW